MLLVSPVLAQTLGLEEALLVQLIQDMQLMQGSAEVTFTDGQRQQLLPFWSITQFGAILQRLVAQGVIQVQGQNPWSIRCERTSAEQSQQESPPVPQQRQEHTIVEPPAPPVEAVPVFNVNEARLRNQSDDDLAYLKAPKVSGQNRQARRTKMHSDWEPSADFAEMIELRNIPIQFALSELDKFRQYYSATNRVEFSWDVKFINWVQRAWLDFQNSKGRHDRQQTNTGEPADSPRAKRSQVRDALRNIQDTDW